MKSIKILGNGTYLPQNKIDNKYFNTKFNLEENWIDKRTGIKNRHIAKSESLENLATEAAKKAIENAQIDKEEIDMIIIATTSTSKIMPGISYLVQKNLDIEKCMCLDILAGCSGYINAFDIAQKYIIAGSIKTALIIGAEVLSKYIDENDINTAVILGDGAGATIITATENKQYASYIESIGQEGEMLTCNNNEKLYMDGKKVYKFAVMKTVENIEKLLEKNNLKIEDIKYVVMHQSNLRIIENICKKLNIPKEKTYINLNNIGNTFCASIPIVLEKLFSQKLVKENDKIILLGYGGGLNLGSILLEL